MSWGRRYDDWSCEHSRGAQTWSTGGGSRDKDTRQGWADERADHSWNGASSSSATTRWHGSSSSSTGSTWRRDGQQDKWDSDSEYGDYTPSKRPWISRGGDSQDGIVAKRIRSNNASLPGCGSIQGLSALAQTFVRAANTVVIAASATGLVETGFAKSLINAQAVADGIRNERGRGGLLTLPPSGIKGKTGKGGGIKGSNAMGTSGKGLISISAPGSVARGKGAYPSTTGRAGSAEPVLKGFFGKGGWAPIVLRQPAPPTKASLDTEIDTYFGKAPKDPAREASHGNLDRQLDQYFGKAPAPCSSPVTGQDINALDRQLESYMKKPAAESEDNDDSKVKEKDAMDVESGQ